MEDMRHYIPSLEKMIAKLEVKLPNQDAYLKKLRSLLTFLNQPKSM